MNTGQGSPARHESFVAYTGDKVQRIRAQVGRDYFLQLSYKSDGRGSEGHWHIDCTLCKTSVLQLNKSDRPFTWTISELLTQATAHMIQRHQLDLTYEHYGENYA